MADIAITAANVLAGPNPQESTLIAGVAITAGQVCYKAADGTAKLAIANGAAPANTVFGIALNGAAIGQPVVLNKLDAAFAPGGTVAVNEVVILSGAVAGNMAPIADLTAGWFLTILGIGIGSNKLALSPVASGFAS